MYLIEHSPGLLVKGINRTFNSVNFTSQHKLAKTFKTEDSANNWISSYMHSGYLCSAVSAKEISCD